MKVDFMQSTREESQAIVRKFGNGHGKFLAEKVETLDEFKSDRSMGYSFFQGYFFSKPIIVPGKAIPGYKLNYMRMLQETNKRELDFRALERIIKQDMTPCYTLLKYINSAYFGFRDEVTSLLSAIVLLGEKEIRRWASLVLFTLMGVDKPPEVVLRSLIRAQMCELLAVDLGLKGHESELFLMGMFSMLDVLIGRPLEEILEEMTLAKEVREALLGQQNGYRDLYDLVVSYESGDWDRCFESASRLNLNRKGIPETYLKAVDWAEEIVGIGSHSRNRVILELPIENKLRNYVALSNICMASMDIDPPSNPSTGNLTALASSTRPEHIEQRKIMVRRRNRELRFRPHCRVIDKSGILPGLKQTANLFFKS